MAGETLSEADLYRRVKSFSRSSDSIERHRHAFLKLPADSHSPEPGNNSGSRPAAGVAEQSNLSKVQPVNDWRTGRACVCLW